MHWEILGLLHRFAKCSDAEIYLFSARSSPKALHHPLSLSWTHHHPIIAQLSNLDANFVRSLRQLCAIGWRHSSNSIYFCIMSVDMKKWKCIQDKLGEKGFRWLKPFDHHLILKAETGPANCADLPTNSELKLFQQIVWAYLENDYLYSFK